MKRILFVETKLYLREWPALVFTLALPLALLLVIGSLPTMSKPSPEFGGERFVDTQLPTTMVLLALATVAFTVLPGALATYREQGVLRRMSTTPVHPGRLLVVQLLINLAVGTLAAVLLIVAAKLVHGSPLPGNLLGFVLVFLLGTAALLALGLVVASVARTGRSAPGIGSAVMFPLLFVAGMWLPREVMPDALRTVSDYSVVGPFVQALRDTWSGQPPQLMSLLVMTAGLAVFTGLAIRLFRWE
ncbi:ABC transporter permease [Nonomuraea sp. NN258]|uniref:ABC transporter permease n=1 Tax=Nonomuraea antri TaxID=2730852 RepID=UPI00156A0A3B|nr:ABC transporter permease [Nonomuraea antri]NRQ32742.1 ABC transporter permease [Nonomuraea antri]